MRRNVTDSANEHILKSLECYSTDDFLILKASIKLYLRPAMYSDHFSGFQVLFHWNVASLWPLSGSQRWR